MGDFLNHFRWKAHTIENVFFIYSYIFIALFKKKIFFLKIKSKYCLP